MTTKRFIKPVLPLFGILLLASPSSAWEFGMDADVFWTGVQDIERRNQLVFFCSQATPGIVQLQVVTNEPGPASVVAVELFIDTSTSSFGPISMRASSQGGNLSIATTGRNLLAMQAAQSVYAEAGLVTLSYYESTWRYPGANYAEAFGAMLDACG